MLLTFSTVVGQTSSRPERCTSSREPAMQVWPEAPNTPATAPVTAAPMSASSKRMLGDLPPSSVVTGTSVAAADCRIFCAVESPPVKLILRTLGCVVRSEEHTSELQSLMLITYAVCCLKKK